MSSKFKMVKSPSPTTTGSISRERRSRPKRTRTWRVSCKLVTSSVPRIRSPRRHGSAPRSYFRGPDNGGPSLTAHPRGDDSHALGREAPRLAQGAEDLIALAQAHNILGMVAGGGADAVAATCHLSAYRLVTRQTS